MEIVNIQSKRPVGRPKGQPKYGGRKKGARNSRFKLFIAMKAELPTAGILQAKAATAIRKLLTDAITTRDMSSYTLPKGSLLTIEALTAIPDDLLGLIPVEHPLAMRIVNVYLKSEAELKRIDALAKV